MKTEVGIIGGGTSYPLGAPEDLVEFFERCKEIASKAIDYLHDGSLPSEMFDDFEAQSARIRVRLRGDRKLSYILDVILHSIGASRKFEERYKVKLSVRLHPRKPIYYMGRITYIPEENFHVQGEEPFWKVCFDMSNHQDRYESFARRFTGDA